MNPDRLRRCSEQSGTEIEIFSVYESLLVCRRTYGTQKQKEQQNEN